jgi:hypothetical protein
MVFVFFSILKCKTTRKDSRGSGGIRAAAGGNTNPKSNSIFTPEIKKEEKN